MGNFTPAGIEYLVKNFSQGMSDLNKLDKAQQNLGKSATKVGKQFTGLGKGMLSAGAIAGGAALAGVTALAGGMVAFGASAIKEGTAFTKAMSNVAAVSGAVGEEFDELTAAAENLGRTTKFTAIEAAEGMSFLAMAGFEVNDIIGAMPGVLNLAAAGNLELGTAADIVSNVLTGFGADVEETAQFVDVLSKTFTSSNTTLEQLGQAMKFVAPVAADLGLSVEETAAAMGTMGDAGIQASMAGTGFRKILLGLAAPTGKASDLIEELGIQVFDAEGKMLPFPEVIGNVNAALAGMSQSQREATLNTLVGKTAIAGFSVLLNKGEKDLNDFGEELRNSGGTAAEIAAKQLDNLAGDVTLLKSALSGLKIDVFRALEPLLRSVVGAGKELLETFGPQLVVAFDIVTDTISNIISTGQELFAVFQAGGTAGIAEALGITPEIIELINKIRLAFVDLGIALGLIPEPKNLTVGFGEDVSQSPLVTGLMFFTENVIPALNAAIVFVNQNFEAFKGAIIGVGAVLAGAAIAATIAGIVTVLGTILSPIGLIIIAAAALGAAWATNWGGIREKTAAVVEFVTNIVMALVSTFRDAVLPPLQAAFNNLTEALNKVGLDWSDVWNAILEAIKLVAIGIGIAILLVITTITGFVTGIATALEVATRFVDDFGRAFTTIFEGIVNVIDGVIGFVQAIIAGEWAAAWDSFLQIFLGIQQLFLGGIDLMSTTLETVFSTSLAFIAGFAQGVIDIFTNLSNVLVGNSIIPDMVASIVETFQALIQPVLDTFTRLSEGISNILGSLFSGAGGQGLDLDLSMLTDTLPQAIADNVTRIQSLISALGELASVLGSPIQSAVKKFKEVMVTGFSLIQTKLDIVVKTLTIMITKLFPDLSLAAEDTGTAIEDALQGVIDMLQRVDTNMQILFTTLGTLNTRLGTIRTTLGTLDTMLNTLNTTLSNLDTPLNTLDTTLGTLDTTLGTLNTTLETIGKTIGTISTAIGTTLPNNITTLSTAISTFTTGALEAFRSKLSAAKDQAENVVEELNRVDETEGSINVAKDALNGIVTALTAIITQAGLATTAITSVGTAISNLPTIPTPTTPPITTLTARSPSIPPPNIPLSVPMVNTTNQTSTTNIFNISLGNASGIGDAQTALMIKQSIQNSLSTV